MEYKSSVLIADGKENSNGRKYNLKDVAFPNEIILYDHSPHEDVPAKPIGKTKLYTDGDAIYGKSILDDPEIIKLIQMQKKLFTVSCGVGNLGKNNEVKDFELQCAFIAFDPSDDRLTPLQPHTN